MTGPLLIFDGVEKRFGDGPAATVAVRGMSFTVGEGEFVSVLGRSGCGKSTTVNLILGLLAPSRGTVSVLGRDPVADFDRLKGRIACVFQSDRLLPWRSAIDNVRLPLEILGIDERDLAASPAEWLDRLDLARSAEDFAHQLSGGMRQRVAFARAMVSDPDIVLADEAFGALDEVTGERLRRDFRSIVDATGKTVLQITHSIDEAITLADRILVFGRPGQVVADIGGIRRMPRSATSALRASVLELLRGGEAEMQATPIAM